MTRAVDWALRQIYHLHPQPQSPQIRQSGTLWPIWRWVRSKELWRRCGSRGPFTHLRRLNGGRCLGAAAPWQRQRLSTPPITTTTTIIILRSTNCTIQARHQFCFKEARLRRMAVIRRGKTLSPPFTVGSALSRISNVGRKSKTIKSDCWLRMCHALRTSCSEWSWIIRTYWFDSTRRR